VAAIRTFGGTVSESSWPLYLGPRPFLPTISVLVPAFNAAATIAAALRSVRRQSLVDWECVVVDDGSDDATANLVAEFASSDFRFRLLRRSHEGIVAALRGGLQACRGEFVARMDADDLMHRERLSLQLAALRAAPHLAGLGCHVRLFPRAVLQPGLRAYEDWLNAIESADDVAREAFVECPLVHPTLMLRREVLDQYTYEQCGWPEDYDLLLRLLAGGQRLGVVPRRLLSWRDHPDRLSRRSAHCSIDSITRCKAAYLARGFLAGSDGYILWGFGGTGKALRRALAEHGCRPSHIVELHPRRLGECIQGASVIPPGELAALAKAPLVVSVAGSVPRSEIRAFLAAIGYRELVDFVCAA